MADKQPIKNFTAEDIEKYHRGMLSPGERHALEKAALDDPFLAEALEGYALAGSDAAAELAELQGRLAERIGKKQSIPLKPAGTSAYTWWRVAAMIILVAGAGLLAYQLGFKKNEDHAGDIARVQAPAPENAAGDTNKPVTPAFSQRDTINNLNPGEPAKDNTKSKAQTRVFESLDASVESNLFKADTVSAKVSESYNYTTVTPSVTPALPDLKKAGVTEEAASGFSGMKQDSIGFVKSKSAPLTTDKVSEKISLDEKTLQALPQKKDQAKRLPANNYYQTANIFRGRVTDAANNPLPFANVTNVTDNVGTYTDAKGNFNLTSPDSVLNVQVRSLGYANNNIQLSNKAVSSQVIMQEDRNLDEVVISRKKPNASARARGENMKLENESEPEDGWENYDSYLANNLNVPEDFRTRPTSVNEVKISFEVSRSGEPVNIRVEKSLCGRCDEEAIRLVKEGPKWKRKKGRTTITVSF